MVDSSDKKNELISKMELFNLIANEVFLFVFGVGKFLRNLIKELKNAVFLIFANKQDVEGCMTEAEITEKFNLAEVKNHNWHIQACSAKKGDGLKEGLDWLTERILEIKKK